MVCPAIPPVSVWSVACWALPAAWGLSTVAEGVETQDQADFLRANNCGSFQGYLMSPALPPDDAVSYLGLSRLLPAAP